MNFTDATVYVVDDDASVRDALSALIRSAGLSTETFASAEDFLRHRRPSSTPACLVLDVRLKGLSGLDLQRELADAGNALPVIFITAYGDVPTTVRAMKQGAAEFLMKPFRDQDLLDAIYHSLQRLEAQRREWATLTENRSRYAALTPRQREVMALVVSGLMNKQVAARLGISEITVKVHRHNIMQTMTATSLPALVRMFERLGLPDSSDPRPPMPKSNGLATSDRLLFRTMPAQPRVMDTRREPLVVAILDDDAALREALESLLRSAGYAIRGYASAEEFLQAGRLEEIGCLVLDVRLQGMGGIELQRQLLESNVHVPTVFITAQEDLHGRLRSQALHFDAVALLHKPLSGEELLRAVRTGFRRYRKHVDAEAT
jgi:FixJ family two-component response regulator